MLSVETLEEEIFSEVIPNELIIRPDPCSAVAQGGTQKVVARAWERCALPVPTVSPVQEP